MTANNNYTFLSNGIFSVYTYENEGIYGAINSISVGNTGYDFNVSINTTSLTIQNSTVNFSLKSPNTFQINTGTYYLNANGSWVIVSSGSNSGITQIETSNGIGGGTITTTGNVYIVANTGVSVNSSGLFINVAYINTISSNSSNYLGGNTATSLKGYSDAAYTNAVSTAATDASTKAGTAYTNAVSTAATDASTKAATAYSNVIALAYVNTAQLTANLTNYQTTAGLAANVLILTSNNSSFLGGIAAASYVQNNDTRVLSGNLNFTGTNTYFTQGFTSAANVTLIGIIANGTIELGHATDTTLSRSAAGELAVEGVVVKKAGKETIYIPAAALIARTTNGSASGTVETTTNKVMLKTLDFDTTTQEFAQFSVRMPKSWNEGTVTAVFAWSHAATTTNFGVVWALEAVAISDGDAGDAAFGTAQQIADTGGTTNALYVSAATSAITIAGTPAAEDWVVFQIKRVVADASDTMAIDARLHGITVNFTTDASTDA